MPAKALTSILPSSPPPPPLPLPRPGKVSSRNCPYGRYLPILLLSSVRLRGDDTRPLHASISVCVYKPVRPAQLLDALCRAMSIQLQREKKAPFAPSLDATLA